MSQRKLRFFRRAARTEVVDFTNGYHRVGGYTATTEGLLSARSRRDCQEEARRDDVQAVFLEEGDHVWRVRGSWNGPRGTCRFNRVVVAPTEAEVMKRAWSGRYMPKSTRLTVELAEETGLREPKP